MERRGVVLSKHATSDWRYLTNSATSDSGLIAPVRVGSRVVGRIDLESDRLGAFAEADADLAWRLAVAVAPLWGAT